MAGYYLYQNNSLEALLDSLAPVLDRRGLFDAPVILAAQNRNMAEWIKLRLAERDGVCARLSFMLPDQAMRYLAGGYPSGRRILGEESDQVVLYMDTLKILLFQALQRELLGEGAGSPDGTGSVGGPDRGGSPGSTGRGGGGSGGGGPGGSPGGGSTGSTGRGCGGGGGRTGKAVFSPLREYLSDPADRELTEGQIYQLADAAAGLFTHYGMNSGGLLDQWRAGRFLSDPGGPLRGHEAWQKALWEDLFGGDSRYHLMSTLLQGIVSGGERWQGRGDDGIGGGGTDGPGDAGPGTVVLFGSAFLSERAAEFFFHLARDWEVHHGLLTVSRRFVPGNGGVDDGSAGLLDQWGGLGAGFRRTAEAFMGEASRDDGVRKQVQADFSLPKGRGSRLAELQRAWAAGKAVEPGSADGSVQVVSVSGERRQVEVLKDRILGLLEADPELQLTDIGVLAPQIGRFQPLVESIFPDEEQGTALPYHLMDLPVSLESAFLEASERLWGLAGGRFSLEEVLPLLRNPCFRAAVGADEGDMELWEEAVREKEIRWGFSGEHREALGSIPSEHNTWARGIEGILDDLMDPGELDGAALRSRSRLGALVTQLYRESRELARPGARRSLTDWVLLTEELLKRFVQVRPGNRQDEEDRRLVKQAFQQVQQAEKDLGLDQDAEGERPGGEALFSFSSYLMIYREMLGSRSLRKGAYLTQGVSFSSFKPLRALPFRHIFVLGMNEGDFPGRDQAVSFDLRRLADASIDMSPRETDRFSFLELLISARESVTFLYQGRDPADGEEREPSVLVRSLQEALFALVPEETVQREALHRWNPRYFGSAEEGDEDGGGGRRLRSYSRRGWREFLAAGSRETPVAKAVPEAASQAEAEAAESEGPPAEISLEELVRFFKHPLRVYVEKGLGAFYGGAELPEEESAERLEPEFLDQYGWYQGLVQEDQLLERIRGELGPGADSPSGDETPSEAEGYFRGIVDASEAAAGAFSAQRSAALAAEGRLSDGILGERSRGDWQQKLFEMGVQLMHRDLHRKGGSRFSLRAGSLPPADRLWRNIPPLEGVLPGGGERRFRITGALEGLHLDEKEGELWMADYCGAKAPKPKHRVSLYLKALFLAALEEAAPGAAFPEGPAPRRYGLYLLGGREMETRIFSPEPVQEGEIPFPGEPGRILGLLAELYLEAHNRPFSWDPADLDDLAKKIRKQGWDSALTAAQTQWDAEGSQGREDDRDAFYRGLLGEPPPPWEDSLFRRLISEYYLPLGGDKKA